MPRSPSAPADDEDMIGWWWKTMIQSMPGSWCAAARVCSSQAVCAPWL
jgi:hypothetical protein